MSDLLKAIDTEYVIKKDGDSTDTVLIGCRSVSLNASCWMRIREAITPDEILKTLAVMEDSMVYQHDDSLQAAREVDKDKLDAALKLSKIVREKIKSKKDLHLLPEILGMNDE